MGMYIVTVNGLEHRWIDLETALSDTFVRSNLGRESWTLEHVAPERES